MRLATLVKPLQCGTILVLIAAHAVLYGLFRDPASAASPVLSVTRDALVFSQVALLLTWLILGPWNWFCRLPAVGLVLWLLKGALGEEIVWSDVSTLMSENYSDSPLYWIATGESNYSLAILVLQALSIASVLSVVRLCGVSVRPNDQQDRGGLQFSLRTLLLLTTVAAVAVWLAQMIRNQVPTDSVVPKWIGIGVVSVAFTAVGLLSVWSGLSGKQLWLRLGAMSVATAILGVCPAFICRHDSDWSAMLSWIATYGALVTGSLLVVRGCGYRLTRRMAPVTAKKSVAVQSPSRLTIAHETVSVFASASYVENRS